MKIFKFLYNKTIGDYMNTPHLTSLQYALFFRNLLNREKLADLLVEIKRRIELIPEHGEIRTNIPQLNFGNLFFQLSWGKNSIQISPNRMDFFYNEKEPFENTDWYGTVESNVSNFIGGLFSYFNEQNGINRLGSVLNGAIKEEEPVASLNKEILNKVLTCDNLGVRRLEMNRRFQEGSLMLNDNRQFWAGILSSQQGKQMSAIGFLRDINTVAADNNLTEEQYHLFMRKVAELFCKEQVLQLEGR